MPVRKARKATAGFTKSRRQSVITWTPAPKEARRMIELVDTGLFGESLPEVATFLLRLGLQNAMRDGFLKRPS